MVDLTPQPPPLDVSRAPTPGVSPGQIAQPYAELADNLDKAGHAAEGTAENFATQAGLKAVSVDDQGNLAFQQAPIIGPASQAFARAEKFSAVAQGEGLAKRADITLRDQFPNDPAGYSAAAEAYKNKIVNDITAKAGPEVGLSLGKIIDTQTTYTYRSMLWRQQENVRRNFDQSTGALIQSKTQDLLDLVSSGGINAPQVKPLLSEIHSLYQERVTNPVLGESPDLMKLHFDQIDRDIRAADFGHRVQQSLRNPSAPYQGMIQGAATKYGLDPNLLTRQLAQESGFHAGQVSPAGAAGIAQFMPATAARYGVDVNSPASSIEGQAHYMSDLSRMFGGNTGLALAGYNWGEGHVAQWLAAGANPNAMPAETRNYVKAITGLPIENWLRGERPNPLTTAQLAMPGTNQGGVATAARMVQGMADDQSVDPTQRRLNVERGLSIIKDYRESLVRNANMTAQQQKATDNNFENTVIEDGNNPKPAITENDIKTAPNVSPEAKMRMLAWQKRQDMPEPMARVSQGNSVELFRRMNLPDGDPSRITSLDPVRQAYIDGNLTRTDEDWLEKKFTDARSPDGQRLSAIRSQFSKAVEPAIDKSNPLAGVIDANGKLQSYAFERYVDQKVDEYRKAGKSPFDLFDPTKPDYLGKPEALAPFQKTLQQSVQELSGRFGGAAPAAAPPVAIPLRKAGEGIADYLARTRGK